MPAIASMLRIGDLLFGRRRVRRRHVARRPPSAASSVVRLRKMSSRLIRIGRSSSSPQPRPTIVAASSRRMSRPRSLSTSTSTSPSRPVAAVTRVTPAAPRALSARRRPARRPADTSSPSRAAAPSGCPGVSTATTRPLLMMTTRWQVCETSGRMCVLRTIVCEPPRSRMSWRVSMICFGSRPAVGSSRISTSGLWMMACASPTRCR